MDIPAADEEKRILYSYFLDIRNRFRPQRTRSELGKTWLGDYHELQKRNCDPWKYWILLELLLCKRF